MATTPPSSTREELERFRFVCIDQMVVVLKYLSLRGNHAASFLTGKDVRAPIIEQATVLQDLLLSVWMMDRICSSGLGRNLHAIGTAGSEEDFICTSAFTSLHYTLTLLEDEFHDEVFWYAMRACLPHAFNFKMLERKMKAQLKLVLSYKGGSLFCFDMYNSYDGLLANPEEQQVFRDLLLLLAVGHGLSFSATKVAKVPSGMIGGTAVVADNGPVHWAYMMIQLGLSGGNWKAFLEQEGGAAGKLVLSTVDLLLQSTTRPGFRGTALLTMAQRPYEGNYNCFGFGFDLRQVSTSVFEHVETEKSAWPIMIKQPSSAHSKRTRCNAMA